MGKTIALSSGHGARHLKVSCAYCGKAIYRYLSAVKKTKQSFCSKSHIVKLRNSVNNPAHRQEVRLKISANHADVSGKNNPMYGKKLTAWNKGRKLHYVVWNSGKKQLKTTGELNPNWRGGITPIHHLIRTSKPYARWRKAVFERDNYTCVACGDKRGGNLEADHIKPFAFFPDLRFDVTNGQTLCQSCHRLTETWGAKAGALYRKGAFVNG